MKMKKLNKSLALLLAFVMCLSLFPVNVFAADAPQGHEHGENCVWVEDEPKLICRAEEHQHTDGCYTTVGPVLECTLEEHTHTAACAGTPAVEACALEEHAHTEGCYDAEGNLVCSLEEHTHTVACDGAPAVEACTLEEHVHTDSCYHLYCTIPEHTHDGVTCVLDENGVCTLEEHTHSMALGCYVQRTLTCTLDEHTHTEACYERTGHWECPEDEGANGPQKAPQKMPAQLPEEVAAFLEAMAKLPEADAVTVDDVEWLGEQLNGETLSDGYALAWPDLLDDPDVAAACAKYEELFLKVTELAELGSSTFDEVSANSSDGIRDAINNHQTVTINVNSSTISFTRTLTIPNGKNVTIRGNGNTIFFCDRTQMWSFPLFQVESGGTLILENVTVYGITDTNTSGAWSGWQNENYWCDASIAEVSGALELKSGATLTGSFTNIKGGGVYVKGGGRLIMSGGTITNCNAKNGGAVYLESGAHLEANSGSIVAGSVKEQGPGVYQAAGAEIDANAINAPVYREGGNTSSHAELNRKNVWLTVLTQESNIPAEPGEQTSKVYVAVEDPNTYRLGTLGWGNTSNTIFSTNAADVISDSIFDNPRFRYGTNARGLVASTQDDLKSYLNGIDWSKFLSACRNVGWNILEGEKGWIEVKATNGTSLHNANDSLLSGYTIYPYVIKYQSGTGANDGWHIDCVVVPVSQYRLTYDINLPENVRTSGFTVPQGGTYNSGTTVSVGYATHSGTQLLQGSQVAAQDVGGNNVTLYFQGWSTTLNAATPECQPNGNITINSDTTLYAVWTATNDEHTIMYTVEYYKTDVDGVVESQSFSQTVNTAISEISVDQSQINTSDKFPGYTFEKTEPATIPSTATNGTVIKVYYKPATESKTYTVEYYKIDSKGKASEAAAPKTVTVQNVPVSAETLTVNEADLDVAAKTPENHVFDYYVVDEGQSQTAVPTQVKVNGTIKVYYVKAVKVTYDPQYKDSKIGENALGAEVVFNDIATGGSLPTVDDPTSEKATFKGWKVNTGNALKSADGTFVSDGAVLTKAELAGLTVEKNVTLKAVWESSINVYVQLRDGTLVTESDLDETLEIKETGQTKAIDVEWNSNHYVVSYQFNETNAADVVLTLHSHYVPLGVYYVKDDELNTKVELKDGAWKTDNIPGRTDVYVVLDQGYTVAYTASAADQGKMSELPVDSTVYVVGSYVPNKDGYAFASSPNNAVAYLDDTSGAVSLKDLPAPNDSTNHEVTGWYHGTDAETKYQGTLAANKLAELAEDYVITLTAKLEEKTTSATYTVKYFVGDVEQTDDGFTSDPQTVKVGEQLTVDTSNINTTDKYANKGYSFTKITVNDSDASEIPDKVAANAVIKVYYNTAIEYQITYELDGGTNDPANPETYTVAQLPITLQDPSKEHFQFLGWTMGDGTDYVTGIPAGTTGDLTFTAHWQENTKYTLTVKAVDEDGTELKTLATISTYSGGYSFNLGDENVATITVTAVSGATTFDKSITTTDSNHYVYVSGAVNGTITGADATVKLVYALDKWHDGNGTPEDPDSPTGGDGIPDSQQVLVNYVVATGSTGKGTVAPACEVYTATEDEIKANTKTVTLTGKATASDRNAFAYWTQGDAKIYDADLKNETLTATLGHEYTYEATFLPDTKGGKDDPDTTGDGTPDAWQVFVKYASENSGSVSVTAPDGVKQVGTTLVYNLGNGKTEGTINRAGATASNTDTKYEFDKWTVAVTGKDGSAAEYTGDDVSKATAELAKKDGMSVTGGTTYTYTAHWKEIGTYTLTIKLVDDTVDANKLAEGATDVELLKTVTYSVTAGTADQTALTGSNGKYTYPLALTGSDGKHYAFDSMKTEGKAEDGAVTVTLIYSLDEKGGEPGTDPENPDAPDNTPDKYQAFVKYVNSDTAKGTVANGTPSGDNIKVLSDGTVVYNLKDKEDHSDTIQLTGVATATTPNTFKDWTSGSDTYSDANLKDGSNNLTVTGGTTYTVTANWNAPYTLTVKLVTDDGKTISDPQKAEYTYTLAHNTSWEVKVGEALSETNPYIYPTTVSVDDVNYVFDEAGTTSDLTGTGAATVTLVYSKDTKGGETDPDTTPDGTPDKYQAFVKYVSSDESMGTVSAGDKIEQTAITVTYDLRQYDNGQLKVKADGTPDLKSSIDAAATASTIGTNVFTGWTGPNEFKQETANASLTHNLSVAGNGTYTYTANWRALGNYTLTVKLVDEKDGKLADDATFTLSEGATWTLTKGDTATAVTGENGAYTYPAKIVNGTDNYVYVRGAEDGTITGDKTVTLVYALDNWKDDPTGDSETGGDGVPDKYQALVKYVVAADSNGKGAVSPDFEVFTYLADGQPAEPAADGWTVALDGRPTPVTGNAFAYWTDDFGNKYYSEKPDDKTVMGGGSYVYTATFLADTKGGSPNPDNTGDSIPDVWQAFVKYAANGSGTVRGLAVPAFESQYAKLVGSTLVYDLRAKDQDGEFVFDANGNHSLRNVIVTGAATATPNGNGGGWTYSFNRWERDGTNLRSGASLAIRELTGVTGGQTYTYTAYFNSSYSGGGGGGGGGGGTPTPPTPPTPPSGGGETEINDPAIPLASAPGLNSTDHFAYVVGYEDGTVRPNANITRAEVATIFFRLMTDEFRSQNWATSNSFSDVNAGNWYNNAVSTTARAGLVNGYPDGSFKPSNRITRAEFAAIAARFLSDDEVTAAPFEDTVGHWAEKDITRAVQAGWITGYPDGTFRPGAYITRAEVMTVVNRMLDRNPDKDHLLPDMIVWPDNPETAWYYEDVQEATNGHDYERDEMGIMEIWTALEPVRDWAALETAWANANS